MESKSQPALRKKATRTRRPLEPLPVSMNIEQRMRLDEVLTLTGWGRTLIYELIRRGKFPEPERYGARCSRWRLGDVLDCLAARGSRK